MNSSKFTGGVRIGNVTSTWPNGLLVIEGDQIIVKDKGLNRECTFKKVDIEEIKVLFRFPLIGRGIRIRHNIPSCKENVTFWYVGTRFKSLLSALSDKGWVYKD